MDESLRHLARRYETTNDIHDLLHWTLGIGRAYPPPWEHTPTTATILGPNYTASCLPAWRDWNSTIAGLPLTALTEQRGRPPTREEMKIIVKDFINRNLDRQNRRYLSGISGESSKVTSPIHNVLDVLLTYDYQDEEDGDAEDGVVAIVETTPGNLAILWVAVWSSIPDAPDAKPSGVRVIFINLPEQFWGIRYIFQSRIAEYGAPGYIDVLNYFLKWIETYDPWKAPRSF